MSFAATHIILELRTEKVTKVAVKLVQIAVTLDILVVVYKSRNKFVDCMNSVLYYEEQAEKNNIVMRYRYSLRILLLMKKVMVLSTSFIGNLSCFMTGNTYISCVVSFITYNVTYLISSIVLTQFCGLILVARQHLIFVNRALFNLSKDPQQAIEKMNELMTYHFEVCNMTIKINQAFSAHLLLIIVRTFVEFFNSLHSIVKEKSHLLVMYDFFWSTCAIFEFIFMLFACKRATE
ncbi:gustatory receptor 205 [Tribolium castaneum]|uniref:Gustatory receptor 205 n=1 Tax=Tribolium castaneum TaxID=7070 RepID=D7EKK8_TRICA|nr:gustatory receptor 205 [Tribolium castaneum]